MPEAFIPFFALLHILGALLGTILTTLAEVSYIRAIANRKHKGEETSVDKHERKYLRRLYRGISIGTIVVILAGSALMVLEYLVPSAPQAVLTAPFWTLQILTLLIVVTGALIARRDASWWFGSALMLSAWWMMLAIDLGFLNAFTFVPLIILYVVIAGIASAILNYIHKKIKKI